MLSDADKHEIEEYLVLRDKNFALRQEDAIREYVEKVLDRIEEKKRAWHKFIIAVTGLSLAGIFALFWNGIEFTVENKASDEVAPIKNELALIRQELNTALLDYTAAKTDIDQKREVLTELISQASEHLSDIGGVDRIAKIEERSKINLVEISRLKLQVPSTEDTSGVFTEVGSLPEGCSREQYLISNCP